MPEKKDPVRIASGEAGAIDHIGKTVDDRLEEQVEFLGVVFEVGILDNEKITRGLPNARWMAAPLPMFTSCLT